MWRSWMSCVVMVGVIGSQAACLEPAPVYASYSPAATKTEVNEQSVLSRLFVPELYLVEPGEEIAHPHDDDVQTPRVEGSTARHHAPKDPEKEDEPISDEPQSERLIGVININTATAKQLELLPRVGESMSQRIIDYRARRAFAKPAHLRRVKGIGKATYARFAVHIVVDGETTLRVR